MDNPETQGTLNQDAKRRQKRTKKPVNDEQQRLHILISE